MGCLVEALTFDWFVHSSGQDDLHAIYGPKTHHPPHSSLYQSLKACICDSKATIISSCPSCGALTSLHRALHLLSHWIIVTERVQISIAHNTDRKMLLQIPLSRQEEFTARARQLGVICGLDL